MSEALYTFVESFRNTGESPYTSTSQKIPVEDFFRTVLDGLSRGLNHVWSRHCQELSWSLPVNLEVGNKNKVGNNDEDRVWSESCQDYIVQRLSQGSMAKA